MNTYVLDARAATNHFPGIGRYVSNLARAMVPLLDPSEGLVLLTGAEGEKCHWSLPEQSQDVRHVSVTASPFSLAQQWQIPRLLERLNASVYHSPYYLMPYRLLTPSVLTVHDLIPELHPEAVSLQARLLFRLANRLALKAAQLVITDSEATRRDLLSHYAISEQRVRTIHLAPDSNLKPSTNEEVAELRTRLELPVRYVLYLGINKPHKNLVRLFEAWSLTSRQLENETMATLVIAGAWDSRYNSIRNVAREYATLAPVRFLGQVVETDLAALYSGAAVFAFPSLYEGFGLPVLEAMACGTAVACSNRSSLPEITGGAALLFNPEEVGEMSVAIQRLLQDDALRCELQERGRQRATQFSWQGTALQTLACYRQILV